MRAAAISNNELCDTSNRKIRGKLLIGFFTILPFENRIQNIFNGSFLILAR